MTCLRQCLEMKMTALELGRELEVEVVRCAGELGCCVEEVVRVCVCARARVRVCVCVMAVWVAQGSWARALR